VLLQPPAMSRGEGGGCAECVCNWWMEGCREVDEL
jgi:hypothetical protein